MESTHKKPKQKKTSKRPGKKTKLAPIPPKARIQPSRTARGLPDTGEVLSVADDTGTGASGERTDPGNADTLTSSGGACAAAPRLPTVGEGDGAQELQLTRATLLSCGPDCMMEFQLLEIPLHKRQALEPADQRVDSPAVVEVFPAWWMASALGWANKTPAGQQICPWEAEGSLQAILRRTRVPDADVMLLPYCHGSHAALGLLVNPGMNPSSRHGSCVCFLQPAYPPTLCMHYTRCGGACGRRLHFVWCHLTDAYDCRQGHDVRRLGRHVQV